MSGDMRYPGWCCRQIAAQLSQALFTMADLHAQVSDLREENRQLKIKIESSDIRKSKEDVRPDEMIGPRAVPAVSSSQSSVGTEVDYGGNINQVQPETKEEHFDVSHESEQGPCLAGSTSLALETKRELIVLNAPLKHIGGDGKQKSSFSSTSQTSGDFKCEKCECCFPSSDLLTIHQAVHIGRSFHVCKVCNAMFLLKSDLSRHWTTHPNMKQHVCQLCGKAYTSKNNYKLHIKTHTGVGLYPCEVCGKAFHSENHLNVHRRIHTGERPYECQYCDKSFTQKSGLINHTRLHTGEKPFLCPSCPKAFTQKSNLNFHLSKHHPPSSDIVT